MKSLQYTIRSIPPQLDRALRQKALQNGQSLNEVLVRTLERGAGLSREQPVHRYDDLDWMVGAQTLGPDFDKELDWLDAVPKDMA